MSSGRLNGIQDLTNHASDVVPSVPNFFMGLMRLIVLVTPLPIS